MKLKKRNKDTRKAWNQIFRLIKPYTFFVLLSLILALGSVIMTLFIPILTGLAVDLIVGKDNVDFAGLLIYIGIICILIGFTAVAQWCMSYINNKITFLVSKDLRTKTFNHIHTLPLSYMDVHESGDLLSRVITDVEQFSDGLLLGFTQLFTGIATIVGTIIFMLSINPVITLVVVVLTPASFLLANFISKKTYSLFKEQSELRGHLTGHTNEMLANLKLVEAFEHQTCSIEEFEEMNNTLSACSLKATFFSSLTNPSTRLIYAAIYAGVTIAGCLSTMGTGLFALSIGQLTSFLSYTSQYSKPFNEITGVITELQNALASAGRVFDLLEQPSFEPDADNAMVLKNPKGEIALSHVFFSYNEEKPLIQDFSLKVAPGHRIAIVGPTGCGKTTLINLLMRFYEINKGEIIVDGYNTKDMTRASLRTNIGMVLQDTWLKNGTIRENIAFGKPQATEEELIQAAKKAHAHSFISRMPLGYDTIIEEDGSNLSAGQKQLLCIARVMLSLPPMLILDEATSSIDTMTEKRIQKAFKEMMVGRTSFVVAHRLSTIVESDQILVMNQGNIIEQGSHEELLKQNGFYAELWRSASDAS